MWVNAQAVYKACYNTLSAKIDERNRVWNFYVDRATENKKFRWSLFVKTRLTRKEAIYLVDHTSYGDHWRNKANRIEEDLDLIRAVKTVALESNKILDDGKCFVGQAAFSMIEPFLNGQERTEDDSRSD